jgi:DNA invertase Pin-like site-specific DNA recombinase
MSKQLRRIGYIRTSLTDHYPLVLADALEQAAYTELHEGDCQIDPRAALKELLNLLGDGDSLLVYCFDRLGRDEHTVVNFQQQLQAMGVTLVVTSDVAEMTGGGHEA